MLNYIQFLPNYT